MINNPQIYSINLTLNLKFWIFKDFIVRYSFQPFFLSILPDQPLSLNYPIQLAGYF